MPVTQAEHSWKDGQEETVTSNGGTAIPMPVAEEYDPASHSMHTVAAQCKANVPDAQSKQASELGAPATVENLPASQGMHILSDHAAASLE